MHSLQPTQGGHAYQPHTATPGTCARLAEYLEVDRRYNYTTPKTFLELIKLYKNVLLRKRKQTQDNVDRLENGLSKLTKVQTCACVCVCVRVCACVCACMCV